MKHISRALLLCLFLSPSAHAASFDCAKAQSKVERIICMDVKLSKLDDELAAAYKLALQDEQKAASIRQAQKRWMRERDSCADAACLSSSYATRTMQLKKNDDTSISSQTCFSLLSPMNIDSEKNRRRVCKSDIPLLLRKPIAPFNVGDRMMFGQKEIKNCGEYLLYPYGGFASDRRDLAIEAPYLRTCGLLASLWGAQDGENKFKTLKQALNPMHLPPSFLEQAATQDQAEKLRSLENEGKTAHEVIREGNVIQSSKGLSYGDLSIEVLAVADVDRDGLNDYIVVRAYSTGTDSSYSVGYLSPANYRQASRWIQFDQQNMPSSEFKRNELRLAQ